MAAKATRLTVEVPSDLLEAADLAVRAGHAPTRNDLVIAALRHELNALVRRHPAQRSAIDAEFARLAGDAEAQAEALQLDRQFASASWEALQRTAEPSCETPGA